MTAPTTKITMPVHQLHGLLKPVLPFAGDDLTLPVLCAVQLVVTPTALYAVATDRYTLAIRRMKPDAITVDEPSITIEGDTPVSTLWATTGITDVLRQIKPPRHDQTRHQVTLTIEGARMDDIGRNDQTIAVEYTEFVEQDAVRFDHHTVTGQMPDLFKLVREFAQRDPATTQGGAAAAPVGLNPTYLARFRHAAEHGAPVKVIADGPLQPTLVCTSYEDGDFFGAQMPMRLHKPDSTLEERADLLAPWRGVNPLGTAITSEGAA